MNAAKRLAWLKAVIPGVFILGILFAKNLWLSARSYPLTPALKIFSILPPWIDYFLLPLLIAALVGVAIASRPRKYIITALALLAFFFLQDQSRLFPSFYEYSLLLFVLAFYSGKNADPGNEEAVLNACRFALTCIYIWAGIQKINPLFINDFSFFITPILGAFPFINRAIPFMLIVAPFIEIGIGLGLLFKKTRKYSLFTAIAMHLSIFFLIGPFRGNWNDSAWAWNLASGFFVLILFLREENASTKKILFNKNFFAHKIILVMFALVPVLGLFNLLDSALAFSVYSGNYVHATIYISESLKERLPATLQIYAGPAAGTGQNSFSYFNIYQWSQDEYNANPYPAERVFKNIARSLCNYSTQPSDVTLTIHDKLKIFNAEENNNTYSCNDLANTF